MAKMERFGPITGLPLSQALRTENFVFISGQVPTDDDGNIVRGFEAQTRLVLDKIKELAEEAGSSLDRIVKTTVFLTDTADFPAMNKIYGEYFPGTPPARSTIRCELMIDIKIEIEAIALA